VTERFKILVVDDDASAFRTEAKVCADLNIPFDFIFALFVEAGLYLARRERPAVVVTDMIFEYPEDDQFGGERLCRELRNEFSAASMKLVLRSGLVDVAGVLGATTASKWREFTDDTMPKGSTFEDSIAKLAKLTGLPPVDWTQARGT
jgi:hypothetical protein